MHYIKTEVEKGLRVLHLFNNTTGWGKILYKFYFVRKTQQLLLYFVCYCSKVY